MARARGDWRLERVRVDGWCTQSGDRVHMPATVGRVRVGGIGVGTRSPESTHRRAARERERDARLLRTHSYTIDQFIVSAAAV